MKFQNKIISSVVIIFMVLGLSFQFSSIYFAREEKMDRLKIKISSNNTLLQNINSLALYNFNREILHDNLKSFISDPDIQFIGLLDIENDIEIHFTDERLPNYNLIVEETPISYSGELLGTITTYYSTERINSEFSKDIKKSIIGILIITAVISTLLFILIHFFLKPVKQLTKITQEISNGNLNVEIPIRSDDDIGILALNFRKMKSSIKVYIESLKFENAEREKAEKKLEIVNAELTEHKNKLEELVIQRTSELKESLENLRKTQSKLIEAEKLSSLGQLVAGVAHEINTPLGVGVTAASYLSDETKEIITANITKTLSKEQFEKYLDNADESTSIILTNLERAATIIQSFKQVAVDQSSDKQREFYLKQYISEILLSISSKLKRTKHRVQIECERDFKINSYPGALSQVMTNLLMNALTHGFVNTDEGEVYIELKKEDNNATIIFIDNGIGIPSEDLKKIFDPFFTTTRGKGGSGLGLSITYNLIKQQLQGSIRCESKVGEGTKFTISFPCKIKQSHTKV